MAGHSRPKDGVASLAYVPAIRALLWRSRVDARDKRGHDGGDGATFKINRSRLKHARKGQVCSGPRR
jgi:hypothetical protein